MNQYVRTMLFFCLLLGTTYTHAYCSAKGNNATYEWVAGVNLAGYGFSSGGNGGYGNFTGQIFRVAAGVNSISLVPGFKSSSYTETWKVWIDYNQDAIFSTDEAVFSGSSSGVLSGNITVPSSALNGSTRMRAIMQFGGTPQPCLNPSYGEVEDYTVIIDNEDITPPVIISKSPAPLITNAAIASDISIRFSEKIDPLSVSNASVALMQNGVVIPGTASVTDDLLRFLPNQTLAYSTEYSVIVYAGILDLAGNPLQLNESWTFSTEAPDVSGPVIVTRSPEAGSLDVSLGHVIQVKFSEAVNPETINGSSFQLLAGGQAVAGSISLSSDKTMLQFYPAQSLANSTVYTVRVTAAVKDLAGNALSEINEWNFTTREYQPTYCSSYATNYSLMWIAKVKLDNFTFSSNSQPATGYSNNTDTLVELSRLFSKAVQLTPAFSSSSYTVYWKIFIDWNQNGAFSADEAAFTGSGKSAVTGSFSVPVNALPGKTRMRVSMQYGSYPNSCGSLSYGEVEDYRVSIPGSAVDTTPPTVVNVSPLDGAQNVVVSSPIVVGVSENLLAASVNNALILQGGNEIIPVTGVYNSTEKKVVFTPTTALQFDTVYNLTLSGLKDVAGNAMVGNYLWSFSTEPEPVMGYSASGNIKLQGVNMAGVDIILSGNASITTVTNNNGNFLLTGLMPGNYLITPSKAGYSFSPSSQGITIVDSNIGEIGFTASAITGVLNNGNFEQGNFSGYYSFTTGAGTANKAIAIFDTDNDGSTSLCAQFSVGISSTGSIGANEGGGIYQVIGLNEGSLSVSVDVAATAGSSNGSGGIVSLLLDGQVMGTHNFEGITGGVNEYATLNFTLPSIVSGNHEIRILLTRTYAAGSVSHYVDDIIVSGTSTQ